MSATAVLPFPMLPALAGSTAEPVPSGVPAMATLSDGALLERVARGDADAFTVLYRRYERPVFAMLIRLASGRRAVAEEWLQEAFTRVWLGASTHDPSRGEVRPWVYKIALNTARSEMARKRYRTPHVSIDETLMDLYASWCGKALALSHARSGLSAVLSGYMGKSDVFDEAIAAFSMAYADQNEKDHAALERAVRKKLLKAVFEEDR